MKIPMSIEKLSFRTVLRTGAFSVGYFGLLLVTADAQINRSHPPSPPVSSGGQNIPRGSTSSGNSGGRTPTSSVSTDTGSASNPRAGLSSLDRFNRSREHNAVKPITNSHIQYIPYFPFGYAPFGYDPYGYSPYGYPDPYPYPPTPYPAYPVPGDRSVAVARYDSPYFYCQDLPGGQYVNSTAVIVSKPKKLVTPTPVYRDGALVEWRDLGAGDYLADRNIQNGDYRVREEKSADPALAAVVADIRESWLQSDVEPLARHVRKETPIDVILRGKYVYSLEAGDFLVVTRAAYNTGSSLTFVLDHLHPRADGIYVLTGRHLFTDSKHKDRTVYFSYVLTKVNDEYVITQIGSAADTE